MQTFTRSWIYIDTICRYNTDWQVTYDGEIIQLTITITSVGSKSLATWTIELIVFCKSISRMAHFWLVSNTFLSVMAVSGNWTSLITDSQQPVLNSQNSLSFVKNFQGSLRKFCNFQWLWNEIKNSNVHFTLLHKWVLFGFSSKRSWKNSSHQKMTIRTGKTTCYTTQIITVKILIH